MLEHQRPYRRERFRPTVGSEGTGADGEAGAVAAAGFAETALVAGDGVAAGGSAVVLDTGLSDNGEAGPESMKPVFIASLLSVIV